MPEIKPLKRDGAWLCQIDCVYYSNVATCWSTVPHNSEVAHCVIAIYRERDRLRKELDEARREIRGKKAADRWAL